MRVHRNAKTTLKMRELIVNRAQHGWTYARIATAVGISVRTIAKWGLNRLALLEPAPPVQRDEWPEAGDLLHVDLKRMGRVTQIGHRIHGDRRRRGRRVGWEYLHVAIDDAARLTNAEVLSAADAPTCAAFLQRTLRWFRRRGIRIRRLLTDNAMAYHAGALAAVCQRWWVRHRFTRPYCRYPTPHPGLTHRHVPLFMTG